RSNRLFLQLRTALKFRRGGYSESGAEEMGLGLEAKRLETLYSLTPFRASLEEASYQKNLSTLSWLEELKPFLESLPKKPEILETGAQDFSRYPAMRRFFDKNGYSPKVTGLELDPYPVLTDFHSRADKAEYYLSVVKAPGDRFLAGDFFKSNLSADCILSFYPFVSAIPALVWGLPAEFGSAEKWVEGFLRSLRPGGILLVVHQGEWEEREFDLARADSALELLKRVKADAKILPLVHPPCLSVYRKRK
ncbi:MAG: hypothetical protein ACXVBE_00135, partial [Bdellovibrionota bacterium]